MDKNIENIIFPVVNIPMPDLIGPIQNLATLMAREDGLLKQIWISANMYDRLTLEVLKMKQFIDGEKRDDAKWSNGLIIINTPYGRVKIRKDDD